MGVPPFPHTALCLYVYLNAFGSAGIVLICTGSTLASRTGGLA